MDASTIKLHGTLKPDGTLELDEKPSLPPGRVQVTLVSESADAPPKEDTWTVLERIWAERKARGLPGRTREEIDAEVSSLRGEWQEREEKIERIRGEAAKSREQPEC
jgi:hypothetical protein